MTDYTKLVEALRICANTAFCNECPLDDTCDNANKLQLDAADAIEALQAKVERLKDCNEELREKQTFIDHYGTEWLTSAKDVPTAAYKHGYADGMAEVKAQLPKRGEWIYKPKDAIEMMFTLPKCSVCGHESSDANNYCPNCGAKMIGEQNVE